MSDESDEAGALRGQAGPWIGARNPDPSSGRMNAAHSWAAALDIDALFEAKGVGRDEGERVRVLWRALAAEYATLALAAGETAEDAAAALATDAGDAAVDAAEIVRGVDARIAGTPPETVDDVPSIEPPASSAGQAPEAVWRAAEDLAFKMMATGEAGGASRTVAGLALGRVLAGFWARFAVDCGDGPEAAAAAVRRHAEGAAELAGDLVRRHRALHGGGEDA